MTYPPEDWYRSDECRRGNKRFALWTLAILAAAFLASCGPGYYRSRQFHDLSRSPSSCPSTIYTR